MLVCFLAVSESVICFGDKTRSYEQPCDYLEELTNLVSRLAIGPTAPRRKQLIVREP